MTEQDNPSVSRGEARRRAMMDAAWETVLGKGFAACTLDDIISVSGGSKSTLYTQFGDKDGLFKTVMQEKCTAFSDELNLTFESDAQPDEMLHTFAELLVEKVTTEESIRFMRLLQAEGQTLPSLTQDFICRGPERIDHSLTHYLASAHQRGDLRVPDPEMYASLLLDMILGRWTESLRLMLLPDDEFDAHKAQMSKKAKAAVDLFLAATASQIG